MFISFKCFMIKFYVNAYSGLHMIQIMAKSPYTGQRLYLENYTTNHHKILNAVGMLYTQSKY